ncbi:MAG: hypothetical protein ACYC1C_09735 [Chloroflexota bacterium]
MAGREAVSLDERELTELQRIILDRDEAAAFAFLREAIWQKIQAARRKGLDPRQGTGVRR